MVAFGLLSSELWPSASNFFCAALEDRFDMAAPIRVGPTLLSIISNAEMEDIISTFMADEKFIVLVAQANSEAHRASRVGQRRFFLRLENGAWVHRDSRRGAGVQRTN